jgi:predicted dinucleotide-utilizing enzyme
LKKLIFGCAEIDKGVIENINSSNKNLDTYVVYDDSEKIEYLNLDGDVVGMEKKPSIMKKTKTRKTKAS